MASGNLWEPLKPCSFKEPLRESLILDHPETDAARLLFLCKRLLHPLLDSLHSRGEALIEMLLHFLVENKSRREERIRPAAPTLDALQLLDLVRLRLERIELSSGVVEMEVEAIGISATPEQLRIFASRARDLDAGNRALARLRAEFGEDSVVKAKLADGHLPEARFLWEPLDRIRLPRVTREGVQCLIRRVFAKPTPLPTTPRTHHDGWFILESGHGAVDKLSGPYVMSGGWWSREIQRDYYFAETRRGDLLWIYYDRVRRCWFLQGRVE
jgi:protein ImuB